MAAATYLEIIDAIRKILLGVTGIGKVADVDDEDGPTWDTHPAANTPYWVVDIAREEQEGKSGAGRQLFEHPVITVTGYMPVNPATRSTRYWLSLIKRVAYALREDPTLGDTVHTCALPVMRQNERGALKSGPTGHEFDCHRVVYELVVTQYVADPEA